MDTCLDCPACQAELEMSIGPMHGPVLPPRNPMRLNRWSMTKEEWAGGWL